LDIAMTSGAMACHRKIARYFADSRAAVLRNVFTGIRECAISAARRRARVGLQQRACIIIIRHRDRNPNEGFAD